MTKKELPALPAATVLKTRRRHISSVWIIPVVAALVGLWLAFSYFYSQGPLVEVRFETAEGVEMGKTLVQCRSVTIGKVEAVRLSKDRKEVVVDLRINRDAENLLNRDTQFWVVRPRLGGGSISGLGTLVSGSYIELSPGIARVSATRFKGLENPPVTPKGVPGLRLTLVSDIAGSLGPGSAIYFKGYEVGRIETRKFNLNSQRVEFGAFIDGAYGKLVTERTRFWNVSGIDLDVSSSGVRLRTGTLESLVVGGVAFDTERTTSPGKPAIDGTSYILYAAETVPEKDLINPTLPYLLLFKESVRGLGRDAPVEFRGIRVGTVMDVSFNYLPDDPEHRVPVLIMLDPSVIPDLQNGDPNSIPELIANAVKNGLRASLSTGSLLTGQLFVDLDIVEKTPPAEITLVGGYNVIPTIASGLTSLQEKVAAVLDKIQSLPLEDTVKNANAALAEIRDTATQAKNTVAEFDQLLSSKETQSLPAELRASLASLQKTLDGYDKNSSFYIQLDATMQQLNNTLRSVDSLSSTIERKPSSLIWGNPKGKVAPPRAKP